MVAVVDWDAGMAVELLLGLEEGRVCGSEPVLRIFWGIVVSIYPRHSDH
jgi:hypothetical protein